MIEEIIQQRAKTAARYACANLGICLDWQDFEDACQAAAEGFWMAWRKKPGEINYAMVAARNQATKEIIRHIFGHNPFNCASEESLAWASIATSEPRSRGLPNDVLRDLLCICLVSRKKKGQRGALAAARDVFICNALAREWNNKGIAQSLHTKPDHIKKYRQGIVRVLEEEKERRNRDADND